jgi:UDPglucose--hexose-1-phosphate uridylyltransferase
MSELRQDLVSGDWTILAPARAKRPHDWGKGKAKRPRAPKSTCPFEDLEKSGNFPIELFPPSDNWKIAVIPNKYPALEMRDVCADERKKGPYSIIDGVGHHELVITRDHEKNLPKMSSKEAVELFRVFKHRLNVLSKDPCGDYSSLWHAWGPSAGASIHHPHYQILTMPIVPPDIRRSFKGSVRYWREHKKCVHCVMLDYEKRNKSRIIYENKEAIALAPYVSRQPFEIRVFPKKHISYFEKTSDQVLCHAVNALVATLRKVSDKLGDPDYNFFLHTAPFRKAEEYKMYHWHMEVIPKLSLLGGFEWSTGIDINTVDPDMAAKILRGKKFK